MDEEIGFDEVRRAILGQRLREDHSNILTDPLSDRMRELMRALESVDEQMIKDPGLRRS